MTSPTCSRCGGTSVLPYGDVWRCPSCGHNWPRQRANIHPLGESGVTLDEGLKVRTPTYWTACNQCGDRTLLLCQGPDGKNATREAIERVMHCPWCGKRACLVVHREYDTWIQPR